MASKEIETYRSLTITIHHTAIGEDDQGRKLKSVCYSIDWNLGDSGIKWKEGENAMFKSQRFSSIEAAKEFIELHIHPDDTDR